MKPALKVILQPTSNRQFTNNKVSAVIYAARFTPFVLLCIYAAITIDAKFWIFLPIIAAFGLGLYIVEDRITDKVSWKYFWKRYYSDNSSPNKEHDLMKELENNPSSRNKENLARHLIK